MITALDRPLREALEDSVPAWPTWLEATAAAVAWEEGAAAHQLHVHVRIRWAQPAFWVVVARILARRTSLRDELLELARRADMPIVRGGLIHAPADRGRRLLSRWLAGELPQPPPEDATL